MYLLDTNVCIQYLNGRSLSVRERLQATDVETVCVCSVVKAELFYGAMKSNNPQRTLANQQQFLNLFTSLPFNDEAALVYGRMRAILAAQGKLISSNDLQIAAIALARDMTLVTHNMKEFSRLNDLRLEDWEAT
jgi:tRNA(fMet)-specific endonuclease VapC